LRWEIIITCTLSAYSSNGQYQVTHLGLAFYTSTFTQYEYCFGLDRCEQIHHGGRGGGPHTKIDNGNAAGSSTSHGTIVAYHGHSVHLRKHIHIILKITK